MILCYFCLIGYRRNKSKSMIKAARKVFNVINSKTYSNDLKIDKITGILKGKHPADISDVIEDLDSKSRLIFFELTPYLVDARVLVNLVNPYRCKTIAFLGLEHFGKTAYLLMEMYKSVNYGLLRNIVQQPRFLRKNIYRVYNLLLI